jgi:hypothetical protein
LDEKERGSGKLLERGQREIIFREIKFLYKFKTNTVIKIEGL